MPWPEIAHSDRFSAATTFRWFLGGWIAHAPEFMVFYAPTVNSYKRFRAGSWAPTRLAWSHDNRTASFRVVGEGPSLRIECRIPGADCNPYLCFAAALASGLDGIANQIEPPPLFDGDVYAAQVAALHPCHTSRCHSSLPIQPVRPRNAGRRSGRALRAFLRARAVGLRHSSHRLGTQALLRTDLSRVRTSPAGKAASVSEHCSAPSPARTPHSWGWCWEQRNSPG